MSSLYPDNVFERWHIQFPDDPDDDPRDGSPCRECGTTFAWRGYNGRCGWCEWFRVFDVWVCGVCGATASALTPGWKYHAWRASFFARCPDHPLEEDRAG